MDGRDIGFYDGSIIGDSLRGLGGWRDSDARNIRAADEGIGGRVRRSPQVRLGQYQGRGGSHGKRDGGFRPQVRLGRLAQLRLGWAGMDCQPRGCRGGGSGATSLGSAGASSEPWPRTSVSIHFPEPLVSDVGGGVGGGVLRMEGPPDDPAQ